MSAGMENSNVMNEMHSDRLSSAETPGAADSCIITAWRSPRHKHHQEPVHTSTTNSSYTHTAHTAPLHTGQTTTQSTRQFRVKNVLGQRCDTRSRQGRGTPKARAHTHLAVHRVIVMGQRLVIRDDVRLRSGCQQRLRRRRGSGIARLEVKVLVRLKHSSEGKKSDHAGIHSEQRSQTPQVQRPRKRRKPWPPQAHTPRRPLPRTETTNTTSSM